MARWSVALSAVSGAVLVTSCSLLTSVEGLSHGSKPAGPGDEEAGVTEAGVTEAGAPDAREAGIDDAASTKPRAWRLLQTKGPPGLHSARMAFDEARGKAVLYGGGSSDGSQKTDTWQWDGTRWANTTLATTPGVRGAMSLAYDSARKVTMLFAGSNATPDPWQWNGSTWQSSGVSPTWPEIAYGSAMAYDRARSVLVIFGGIRFMGTVDSPDTWEWSATSGFAKRTPAVSPPARHAHVLVYDIARSRVVLFGGSDGQTMNDLWEWDGTSWEQRTSPLSPAPRRGACAAYDAVRRVTVVFGGRPANDNTKALGDTWEWDGTTWQSGATGPAARSSCAMTFDAARNQIVMFGGSPRRVGLTPTETVEETWVYE